MNIITVQRPSSPVGALYVAERNSTGGETFYSLVRLFAGCCWVTVAPDDTQAQMVQEAFAAYPAEPVLCIEVSP